MSSLPIVYVSSNTSVNANVQIHTNSSLNSFTITFPTSPTDQSLIRVIDIGRNWSINSITIQAGGSDKINGNSSIVLSSPGSCFDFYYISENSEWIYFFQEKLDPNIVNNVTTNSFLTSILNNNTLNLQVSSGSLTESNSNILTLSNLSNSLLQSGTIEIKQATSLQSGYLSSTDFNIFNNKQNLISSPTNNNFVYTDVLGQTKDSGVNLSLVPTTNSNTSILSSAAVQTAIANSISGVLKLQGTWNAFTNTPLLEAGTGIIGYAYYTSVAGTQTLPSGTSVNYTVGDLVFYTNTNIWDRLESSNDVNSVFGRTGIVTAQSGDYNISQITNGLSNQLLSSRIYIGDSNNLATSFSLSGDAILSNTGILTIFPNVVSNSKLTQAGLYTWKGNNTNTLANVSDNLIGSLTETGSNILTISNGSRCLLNSATIQVSQTNSTTNGFLSSTDWNTFNNKQNTLSSGTTVLTIINSVINFANQAANTILAGSISGGLSTPSFRTLQTADIFPAILSGIFTNGVLAVYNGTNFSPTTGLTWLANKLTVSGIIETDGITVDEVAGYQGIATLGSNGRVTVSTPNVRANSRIFLTTQVGTGTIRECYVSTRTANTSFVIQSLSTGDRSQVAWMIINPV